MTVQVTGPVPEDSGLTGPCASGTDVRCDAGPIGAPGCTSDPDAGYYQGLIPGNRTYPAGCIVNFPDPRPLKQTGECTLTAQCTCTDPSRAPGTAQWTCVR
jgi:hypothetical protein